MPSQFDNCATEYEKFRPEYPAELFQFLIDRFSLSKDNLIVDIGCGTARATLPFAQRGLCVLGLDPGLEMLRTAKAAAAKTETPLWLAAARVEALAVTDQAADFINCAQAFHWFDPAVALAEFDRILKPSGGMAIYWNNRDDARAAYLIELERLIVQYNPKHKLGYRDRDWGGEITHSGRFQQVELQQFHHSSLVSIEDIIGLTRSFSYVRNVLSEQELNVFAQELHGVLCKHADADGKLPLPYRVDLWHASKRQ